MKRALTRMALVALAGALVAGGMMVGSSAEATPRSARASGGNARAPHNFSDAFLRANGIEPTRLVGQRNGTPPNSVLDPMAPDAEHSRVRLLETSATFDDSGHPWFFVVGGVIFPNTFTNDAAGARARQIAEQYVLYDFPRAANARYATFPKRQEAVSDFRNGYFSNDPLGIWKIKHVKYTDAAFSTPEGRRRLADLAARNGTDLDGTPLMKTVSEIESMRSRGLVTVDSIPTDGSAGPPWFICTIVEDPRNGAIAADAFQVRTARADGTRNPGERIFDQYFDALQRTGDFPH